MAHSQWAKSENFEKFWVVKSRWFLINLSQWILWVHLTVHQGQKYPVLTLIMNRVAVCKPLHPSLVWACRFYIFHQFEYRLHSNVRICPLTSCNSWQLFIAIESIEKTYFIWYFNITRVQLKVVKYCNVSQAAWS